LNSTGWPSAGRSNQSTPIPPVLKIVLLVVFASTLFSRVVDPVVPQIAADLLVDVKTAALLSTAFTLPYALTQPVLGTIADFFGKTRLMTMSLLIVSITALVCAVATSFSLVFGMRVQAGLVAGGVFPVAMALVGDLVPIHQRQVMIGRLLAVGLTGNVLGAAIAGVIGDLFGWRGIFAVTGGFGLIITAAAFYILRSFPVPKPRPAFNLPAVKANYRSIFADPRAKFCFGSVFFEGIFIHGIFPYVAILLLASGEASASIAGLVIAAFGLGGVIYSLSVPALVNHFAERRLMLIGGALAAAALTFAALHFPWGAQVAIFGIFGFGFYLLHGSIQVHVTDLSVTARGAATSVHSSFFFMGQATGPVLYGFGYAHGSLELLMFLGSAVIMVIAVVCSRFLRHRNASPPP
jgi:predicted MFS family arabinose efflux permease